MLLLKDLKTLLPKSFNEGAITFETLRQSVNVTHEKQAHSKPTHARANQPPCMKKI